MILDERILRLIAVGASISANCEACLRTNSAKARENGASEMEIAEAVWVGTLVRRGAASKMDQFAARVNRNVLALRDTPDDACDCG